jgi:hypothetical protein
MEHTNTLCGQNAETLYIRFQAVPHRKHTTSLLQRPTGYCCLGIQSLFIVRTTRNTQIPSVVDIYNMVSTYYADCEVNTAMYHSETEFTTGHSCIFVLLGTDRVFIFDL